jgi:hypothetical protein
LSSQRSDFSFLDRVHATVSASQGQRIAGGFVLITAQGGIRYAVRPNQVAVIHNPDECYDETVVRIYGGHIVRVPCSMDTDLVQHSREI